MQELWQSFSTSLSCFHLSLKLLSTSPFVSGVVRVAEWEQPWSLLGWSRWHRHAHVHTSFSVAHISFSPSLSLCVSLWDTHAYFEAHKHTHHYRVYGAIRCIDEDAHIKGNTQWEQTYRADKTTLLCLNPGAQHLLMRSVQRSVHVHVRLVDFLSYICFLYTASSYLFRVVSSIVSTWADWQVCVCECVCECMCVY